MAEFKFSVVIPNYNGQKLLAKNLPAVIEACQQWGRAGWEIIVVDDASTDGSVSFLKKEFPQIKLVVHQKNQRFAAACNSGVKKARGEKVVLLNNDVLPEPNFLKPLLNPFKDSEVFSVGCKEKDIKKGKLVFSGRGQGEFKRGLLVHWRAQDQDQKETLWTTGGSMAVDRGKWLDLGGMDTLFRPAYWEDIDLSWRARKKGWLVLFAPKSVVNHHHETTHRSTFGERKMKIYGLKNQFLFVWKNADFKRLSQHVFWLPYHLLVTNWHSKGLLLLGFFLALVQLPELLFKKILR